MIAVALLTCSVGHMDCQTWIETKNRLDCVVRWGDCNDSLWHAKMYRHYHLRKLLLICQ